MSKLFLLLNSGVISHLILPCLCAKYYYNMLLYILVIEDRYHSQFLFEKRNKCIIYISKLN